MRQPRSRAALLLAALAAVALLASAASAQPAPEPRARPGVETLESISPQPGLVSPYPPVLEVAFLVVIVGGVWITYGYVVYQVYRISVEPPPRHRP